MDSPTNFLLIGSRIIDTAETVQKFCSVFNTIIDIGCANGDRLFLFEKLGFSKLIGIDKQDKGFHIGCGDYISKTRNICEEDAFELVFSEEKFFFFEVDVNDYVFERENYSFILCYNFLHFIPDSEKYILIERLYNLLEPGGLMYLKLNHSENKNNTDPSRVQSLGGNIYKPYNPVFGTVYLVEKSDFLEKTAKYPKIEELTECDEKAVVIALKKPNA